MDKNTVSIAILILAVGVVGFLVVNATKNGPAVSSPPSQTSNGGWFSSVLGLGTAIVNKVNFGSGTATNEGSSSGRTYSGAGDGLMKPDFA